MAMSFGQHKSDGHSHGPLGHGGQHRIGGHGSSIGSPMSNPHVQTPGGHTMDNQHGGNAPMGC